MKTRTPLDRRDLRIKKGDRVLEIGSGHNPSYRSNVIVEKFIDNNYHRSGDVKLYPHQTFVNADGECLPFRDKEFDYVICNQVLEHVDDPVKFIQEQCRVAKRGYVETPSLIGEFLFPKASHKWVILDIDDTLVLFEKTRMPGNYGNNYGELFLNYLPYHSLPYKLLWLTESGLMLNKYEWKDEINIIVNPDDSYYKSFFLEKWDRAMTEKIFPPRSLSTETRRFFKALLHTLQGKIESNLYHRDPLNMEEYRKMKNL
ncbi:MAG: SAM-dependent methyltransferase [Bacteroidetes bacterium GWD2_45_23]|nr:MAG: SAM-dependent methyltransferase [Bacteroidetes bacterium GWC2_46_850]OFX80165.1 MAG: SAM-dependent methyltransferase [Bacteroidetes bacterium GWC1_47_7]OFX86833.1 MAG: SAM-dependent methyltransferase [Bacteroidetes bacterium GWD2_45_23]HBA99774.1 SAM-dependent methyltransferase [Porphyromonadaceae bacterium]HCC18633.1 SAM-dependent methyltransferase [Porphyromonadaceae bacterium]